MHKVFARYIFFCLGTVTYTLFANSIGRTLGYWLVSIDYDDNVLQFNSANVNGALWAEPTVLVNDGMCFSFDTFQ